MFDNVVGVLGGLGPLATAYFMDMVIKKTDSNKDQGHINMLVYNHATIPDRTAYIMNSERESPLVDMIEDAKSMEKNGVSFIVIPCNTAHYFYDEIQASVRIPVINIIDETVNRIVELKREDKVGILATDGTLYSDTYQRTLNKRKINYLEPSKDQQESLMEIIYGQVKCGKEVDIQRFNEIILDMRAKGCSSIILGCTELSIIRKDYALYSPDIIDSLEVLSERTIIQSGKKLLKQRPDYNKKYGLRLIK